MELFFSDLQNTIVGICLFLFLILRFAKYYNKLRLRSDGDDDSEGGILNINDLPIPDLPPGVTLSVDEKESTVVK